MKFSNVMTGGNGNKLTVPMKPEVESLYPKVWITEKEHKAANDKINYAFALGIQNTKKEEDE